MKPSVSVNHYLRQALRSSRPQRVREPLPLSGENVSSMIVMTRPSPVATTAEPPLTEAVAAEEQDPPAPVRPPRPQPKAQDGAQAEACTRGA